MEQKQIAIKGAVSLKIEVTSGPEMGAQKSLTQNELLIGRSVENDICLNKDLKVSRVHAKIFWQSDRFYIKNLSSKNTLLLNGSLVTEMELPEEASIELGESKIQIHYQKTHSLEPKLELVKQEIIGEKTLVIAPESPIGAQLSLEEKTNHNKVLQKNHLPSTAALNHSNKPANKAGLPDHLGAKTPGPNYYGVPNSKTNKTQKQSSLAKPPPTQSYTKQNTQQTKTNLKTTSSGLNPLHLIIAIVVLVAIYFYTQEEEAKKPDVKKLRSEKQITEELKTTETLIEEHKKSLNLNENNELPPNLQRAQEYYLKGFRDYMQGQYVRAMQAFQATLSFDPSHNLAKKYLAESRRKQEEFVQIIMLKGRRYRDKGHYRLCAASYKQALQYLSQNKNSSIYDEALKNQTACETLMQGRY